MDHILGQSGRIVVARLAPGEDLLHTLEKIATAEKISSASVEAIGTLDEARMAFFDEEGQEFIGFTGRLELISCLGNISLGEDGTPMAHLHVVVSDAKGRCLGGHALEGCKIAITAEVVIRELRGVKMERAVDETGRLSLQLRPE